ncbi:MAG TPA: hypothetical protein VGW80_02925 [Solirubrobacterales bacterium]|nr:hypothetical protein [Solirubrobacterales bacterium]
MDGVGLVRDADTVASQLFAESYRPGAGHSRGFVQRRQLLRQRLRTVDGRLPEPLPLGAVESSEDLAPPAVEDRQRAARVIGLRNPAAQRVEGADAPRRQAEADAEAAGGRDPDPDPGEGAGAETYSEQVDPVPAAGRGSCPLDLLQEPGRVPGPPLRGEPQLRLVQDLTVAPGAGDGVDRRGVEADDDQGCTTP